MTRRTRALDRLADRRSDVAAHLYIAARRRKDKEQRR